MKRISVVKSANLGESNENVWSCWYWKGSGYWRQALQSRVDISIMIGIQCTVHLLGIMTVLPFKQQSAKSFVDWPTSRLGLVGTPLTRKWQTNVDIIIVAIFIIITVMMNVLSSARNPPASRPKWQWGISDWIAHICSNKGDFVNVLQWERTWYLTFTKTINVHTLSKWYLVYCFLILKS